MNAIIQLNQSPEPVAPEVALATVFADLSPNTLKAYGSALQDFASAIGAASKEEAARTLFSLDQGRANLLATQYRTHLMHREPPLAAATVSNRLACLAGVIKRVHKYLGRHWKLDVEGVDVTPMRDTRGPGMATIEKMRLTLMRTDTPIAKRNRAILELLWSPALRRAECGRLDLSDVDFEGSRVRVLGKGKDDYEWLTIPEQTLGAIRQWVLHRGDWAGPLFVNMDQAYPKGRLSDHGIYEVIVGLGMKSAGKHVRPHAIRHSALTTLLNLTNGDVRSVQRFSRHAGISTLLVYDDNREDVAGRMARMVSGET